MIIESKISENKSKKKINKYPSRVTLTVEVLNERVKKWKNQIKDKFNGLVEVTNSDLVNFALLSLPNSLNSKQLKELRVTKTKPDAIVKWIDKRAKEAMLRGERPDFVAFAKEVQGINKRPKKVKEKV